MIVGCLALIGSAGAGFAPSPRKVPSHHGPTSRLAPDTTGSIPSKPGAKPATAASDSDEALPDPFYLPTASRARVRDCGEKWQQIKLSGQVGEMIWRDFATTCLASKTGPFDNSKQ